MAYRLSVLAEQDITDIAMSGIQMFGEQVARRYHDDLFDLFDLLADNPRLARERQELSPPVRIHPHRSHLIVYTIEDNDQVLILRIRHAHEDWISDLS